MIFVTVGTTMAYDSLIQEVDNLVERRFIQDKVICQIGNGEYVPKNCEYFRFRPSIDDLISEAVLVISHGGSTVMALISLQKRCVIMANKAAADSHQRDFLRLISNEINILWSEDVAELSDLIVKAYDTEIYYKKPPSLAYDLVKYINYL
jgi:beta-1,4-N-acetylglucosaminyltransferase